jgi:hypothetical protein
MAWRLEVVPARVLLREEAGACRLAVVDEDGTEQVVPRDWPALRHDARLHELIGMDLTDRCFEALGREARIAWFALDPPAAGWEGLVTLEKADPARIPGRVPPFVVQVRPGRGVLLPSTDLRLGGPPQDAWETLATVARRCGTPPPVYSFVCGWSDHRSVRVGRGRLGVGVGQDGSVQQIYGSREAGWGGNPELRLRYDGIDLLGEPAQDVLLLLTDLGHEVVRHGPWLRLPGIGVTLQPGPDGKLVETVTLDLPDLRLRGA